MAVTKRILILANSVKKGGRCVAGKELFLSADGTARIGGWIRPIDRAGDEGTISTETTRIDGRILQPFDVVDIECSGSANDPHHPEDWFITPSQPWKMVAFERTDFEPYLKDESGDLWGRSSAKDRKVTPEPGLPTLRFVRPAAKVRLEAYDETQRDGRKMRRLLHVEHHGIEHLFSIDDPLFTEKHRIYERVRAGETIKEAIVPRPKILVVSLTPPFHGFHYKIAATIIEP